jgi:hypothetical protein
MRQGVAGDRTDHRIRQSPAISPSLAPTFVGASMTLLPLQAT